MVRIRKRRTLRLQSIILIGVITGIIGIAMFAFIISWIDEHTASNPRPFKEMNCVQLLFYEYGPEYEKLNEEEIKEFREALAPCLDP